MNKRKFFFVWAVLFFLNTLDILFTLYGIKTGFISEGNPLMLYFLTSRGLIEILVLKYFFVLALLIIIALKEISFFSGILIYITTGILGIIVLMHIHWIVLSFT